MIITIDTTNCSREEVQELKDYLEENCWNWKTDEKEEIEEEEKPKYVLTDDGIFVSGSKGVTLNEKINDEELFEYRITHRKDFIDELIRWIGEAGMNSSRAADKVLMEDDLKMLMDLDDEYIFSSVSTNAYISSEDSNFNETCEELIVLNNSL